MNIKSHVTRRHFLQSATTGIAVAGGVFTGAAPGPKWLVANPVTGAGSPVFDKSRRVLFFDEGMIESLKKTRFVLNPAVKAADNPVIRGDRPWEGKTIAEVSVVYDEELQLFRMWYPVYDYHPPIPPPGATESKDEKVIADVANEYKKCTACYAVSADGIHWEKPALGLVEYQGSKANNILMASGPHSRAHFSTGHIFLDSTEKDHARRYKAIKSPMRAGPDGTERMAIDLYYSPDGFQWTAYEKNPVYELKRPGRWGPTSFMGWDPIRKVYVVYMENCGHQLCPVNKRLIGRAQSPDMIHWSESETILVPDETDGPIADLYALHPFMYEDFCVGMLWMFSEATQTHYPQFVFSRDGIRFDRRFRQPFIHPGVSPAFDSNSILPLKPILRGDQIYIYYIGANYRTQQQFDVLGSRKAEWSIGLATVPRDQFVSLENKGRERGEVVTRTLRSSGSKLIVNMKVAGQLPGELKVEILDPAYFPVAGHSMKEADALARSGLDNVVTWNTNPDISRLAGKPVKLRFHLTNANLFSFRFAD